MEIKLYTFSKRRNSTAIPSGEGYAVSVALKSPTSEREPVFQLAYDGELVHNYLKWGSRWYWVTGARHIHQGLLEISAQLDELATLRAEIFATDAFVLYDTTPNTQISDGRLSMETELVEASAYADFSILGTAAADPAVVITVTGEDSVGSYYLKESEARTLLADVRNWADNAIPDPVQYTSTDDIFADLADTLRQYGRNLVSMGDAADNIRAAIMLPLPPQAFTGTQERVMLGLYRTGVRGLLLDRVVIQDWARVVIPWQVSDWRRNSPYTSVRLYVPWLGMISYPSSALIDVDELHINAAIDIRTGDAIFTVFAARAGGALGVVGRYNASIGAIYPIGSTNLSPLSAVSAIGSVAAGAAAIASGGLTAVMGGAAAIVGVSNNVTPLETTAGGVGSAASFALLPRVICYTVLHDTVVDPASVSAVIGTPAMAVKRLGSLSGFVQTRCASVAAAAMQQDIDAVNAALDGGVYIE